MWWQTVFSQVIGNADDAAYVAKWSRRHVYWWYIAPTQYFYEILRDALWARPRGTTIGLMSVLLVVVWRRHVRSLGC